MRLVAWLLALGCATAVKIHAQVRADPGTVINGRIAVRVYVTLSDEETPYAPISGLELRFFRSATDNVVVRTDDAGAATVLLPPGDYRVVSGAPTTWKGARYTWSVPLTVRSGMGTVDLKASSAERVGPATDVAVAPAPVTVPVQRSQPVSSGITRAPKDGTTGTLFSFLLVGGGQLYANEPGRGLALLGLGIGGFALAVAGANNYDDCYGEFYQETCYDPNDGMIAVGLAVAVGSWIYSMVDAGAAARRYNTKHGLANAGVRPIVSPAGRGRTALGLSVAYPR